MALASRHSLRTFRPFAIAAASLLFSLIAPNACFAQARPDICNAEGGSFEDTFRTGVSAHVAPARNDEGFATRRCEAGLSWDNQNLVIAASAAEIDVDLLGADLGLGAPVVAFEVLESETDCCLTYQIYSLAKPPKLLRTIRGGERFYAGDTDLDGRVEIWTDDAAIAEGFDGLPAHVFDLAPMIVLRFESGRLLDVSSEFTPAFDEQIALLRSAVAPGDLLDFKNSDGRLVAPAAAAPLDDLHIRDRLRYAKAHVLMIVWSYLYSGREDEAWKALAAMWPDADFDRIRAAIMDARARGMRAQLDGVSAPVAPSATRAGANPKAAAKPRATIFDLRTQFLPGRTLGFGGPPVLSPRPISLPGPPGQPPKDLADSQVLIELLIDSAGKVRSATGRDAPIDPAIRTATADWKFVPAFVNGKPVACRMYFGVSLER
jgi:hypothetical protein